MKKILFVLFLFFSFRCFAEEKLLFQPNEFLELSYDEIVKTYPDIKDFVAMSDLKNGNCAIGVKHHKICTITIQKIKNIYFVYFSDSYYCGSAGCLMEIYKDGKDTDT